MEQPSNSSPISVTHDSGAVASGGEMSEAIMKLVQPSIEALDTQVRNTRHSQIMLANNIGQLSEQLKTIADDHSLPYSLDAYVQKLDDTRLRVAGLSTRLSVVHDRMGTLQRNIARETFRQKQAIDTSSK